MPGGPETTLTSAACTLDICSSFNVFELSRRHGKNLESDLWRRMQLWRHTANQSHPVSGFYTGDIHTLLQEPRAKGIDLHQRMLDFYHQHYSANLMWLCVYGCEPLSQLEELAQEKFSSVPGSKLQAPSYPGGCSCLSGAEGSQKS